MGFVPPYRGFVSHVDEKTVRTQPLLPHAQVRDAHGFVRRQALRDPVLHRALVGRVDDKRLRRRIPRRGGVDDEPRVDPRQALGEAEASELTLSLDLLELGQLFGPAQGHHGPGEQIELHGESDPEPRTVRWGVRREQPMGGEELGRVVPHVRETQGRLANQRAEEVRALAVADALGAQPGEFRGEGPAPCASRVVVAFGGGIVNFQGVPGPRRRRR